MYKGTDREDLTNSVQDANEAIDLLMRVKELLDGTVIVGKEMMIEAARDLISDIASEVEDMDEAMVEANAEEEAEEEREYWRSVL